MDWFPQCQDNVNGILGHVVGSLIFQWGSTIKTPLDTVSSWYPSDMTIDVARMLQQSTKYWLLNDQDHIWTK